MITRKQIQDAIDELERAIGCLYADNSYLAEKSVEAAIEKLKQYEPTQRP